MREALDISITPECLDEGSVEECATFGVFTVRVGDAALTEGFDTYANAYRPGPLVSGYPLAEWLGWNWWRLRWEPRVASLDWAIAHQMSSIGEGWVWPNITIFSDGERTALISSPSAPDAKPFRYLSAVGAVVPSRTFEAAVDAFIGQIFAKLEGLTETNLHKIWRDVLEERRDPHIAERRRLEALMGRNADADDESDIERLLADERALGAAALEEIAAERGRSGDRGPKLFTAEDFRVVARASGHSGSLADAVRLEQRDKLARGPEVAAWRFGAAAAGALREQEHLGSRPIEDRELAAMAGVESQALANGESHPVGMSFAFSEPGRDTRFVLRSRWHTGRRFELARLLGDRIVAATEPLQPATRAFTYRQKAQRSFAAEFLCPYDELEAFLAGDYSPVACEEAADQFEVSPMTIETLLMNHGRLEREPILDELESAA